MAAGSEPRPGSITPRAPGNRLPAIQPHSACPIEMLLPERFQIGDWFRIDSDFNCERIPIHLWLFERLQRDRPSQSREQTAEEVSVVLGIPTFDLLDDDFLRNEAG